MKTRKTQQHGLERFRMRKSMYSSMDSCQTRAHFLMEDEFAPSRSSPTFKVCNYPVKSYGRSTRGMERFVLAGQWTAADPHMSKQQLARLYMGRMFGKTRSWPEVLTSEPEGAKQGILSRFKGWWAKCAQLTLGGKKGQKWAEKGPLG